MLLAAQYCSKKVAGNLKKWLRKKVVQLVKNLHFHYREHKFDPWSGN